MEKLQLLKSKYYMENRSITIPKLSMIILNDSTNSNFLLITKISIYKKAEIHNEGKPQDVKNGAENKMMQLTFFYQTMYVLCSMFCDFKLNQTAFLMNMQFGDKKCNVAEEKLDFLEYTLLRK